MHPNRLLLLVPLAFFAWLSGPSAVLPVRAEESSSFRSLSELNAAYFQQLQELDRRRIADLAKLAASLTGTEADASYTQLFQLAVVRGLAVDADPAAARCLTSKKSSAEVQRLAQLIQVLAKSDRGEHVQALASVKGLMQATGGAKGGDPDTVLAVGEAYLQRLIREGRYHDARALCECACEAEDAPAAVKDHFEGRMDRISLLGKPAPPIAGTDVDGKSVSLASLKGKVVLVDFWATWCPPCVAAIPGLNTLAERYRDRGFEVLGVNVDALHEDVKDTKTALPVVRRFLVEHDVPWTCLLNGAGPGDVAKAYGVSEIPANFLIDRDGKVIAFELTGDGLERAVVRALGGNEPARSQ